MDLRSLDLELCVSTNDELKKLAEDAAAHGSYVTSIAQLNGRGREDREWVSDAGNLYLSVLIRDLPMDQWTWVPLMTAAAIAHQLSEELDYQIKWPNDLFLGGKKSGGILCESVGRKEGGYIIVGIGLNIAHSPDDIDRETSSQSEFWPEANRNEVLPRVLLSILSACDRLREEGPGWIEQEYQKRTLFPEGTWIRWDEKGEEKKGIAKGLGQFGELRVWLNGARSDEKALMTEEVASLKAVDDSTSDESLL